MPGLGDKVLDSFKSNLGITEKAIIEVIDLSERKEVEQDALKVVGGTKASAANRAAGSSLANAGMLADEAGLSGGKVIADEYEGVIARTASKNRRYFTVQFNPSTLQLSGHGGGRVRKLVYDPEDKDHDKIPDKSAQYTEGPTTIYMSVSLFFDSCDPQTAFLEDKLILNPTGVGTGIAKGALQATGNKKMSVQTEVEGFIAALRNQKTRFITFYWGEICYSGVLRSVGANYTMFNPNGEPVRATVDLSIVCADKDQWPNSLKVWQQRYMNDFKDSESFVKTEQMAGSLLNL